MRRLKILRVVIGLNQGGVQQGVLNLCRGLDPQRFEVIACAIENGGAIAAEIETAGAEVIVLGHKRQPWKTIPALAKLMRERCIDIVHASSYHPSLYARFAGLMARVPVLIGYEHVVFTHRRRLRTWLNRWLEPHTQAFTAVGETVAAQVRDWYGYPRKKVHVVHNGVDLARFQPPIDRAAAKRAMGFDPHRPVVGMICRLDEEKGHRYFFEAIRTLNPSVQAQWLIVGMGRGEAMVKSAARDLGVDELVQFLGLRRDIPELLAAFDLYVFPTLKEGFPNALLEAMASGCAVVASNFPGNLEVARHEHNALIVPMGNTSALANAIARLLNDHELAARLGEQARRDIETDFSLQTYSRNMAALYEELWAKKRR